jgi:fluoride exporter
LKGLFYIALGGALGSVFRYLTSLMVNKVCIAPFPYATLITNVLGCLLMGLLFGHLEKTNTVSQDLKLFLITGFCGGYTTFSTFSLENMKLLQSDHWLNAFVYIGLSVFLGLIATWFGLFIVKLI